MSRLHARAIGLFLGALATAVCTPAEAVERGEQEQVQPRGTAPRVPAASAKARRDLRAQMGAQALMSIGSRTGTPRVMGRLDGLLTGESARDNADIAIDYVRGHADVVGVDAADLGAIKQVRRYAAAGIEHITWQQSFKGIPAIDSSLTANLTVTGRLINVGGAPRHDLAITSVEPKLSAGEVYDRVAAALGGRGAAVRSSGRGATRAATFEDGGRAALVIYEAAGGPRLGWRLLVPVSSRQVYDVVADAATGRSVRTQNLVEYATATRFENYPGATVGGTAADVTIDTFLNSEATTLAGPFAHTFLDVDDVVHSPDDPDPASSDIPPTTGNWNYATTDTGLCFSFCTWDPFTANSWETNKNADATQIHWFVSNFHDHLENTPDIAFTNAAGNFEGADPVRAQSLDGANLASGLPEPTQHLNNANMATYPEGTSPHMQMYLTDVQGGQSTGYDSTVIYHEYTHGLVGRSIVDSQGFQAIGGPQGGAINEGTADWYAVDYVYSTDSGSLETDDPTAIDVIAARFTFGNLRTEPADCAVAADPSQLDLDCQGGSTPHYGGYTYGDLGSVTSGPEVHADGEIFTQTMWQLRSALITKHGAATGIAHTRRLYTNGMRLAPDFPSFLDLRNAILQANTAAGFTDDAEIWDVFASRGMGYFASTTGTSDVAPIENFSDVPAPAGPKGTVTGTVTESATGAGQPGVSVGFTGHDSGVGPDLTAVTNASGVYAIANVPAGTYPMLIVRGGGLERGTAANVTVAGSATTTRNFSLRRNLASEEGGASIVSATGPDFSSFGCGPDGLIDFDQGRPWASTAPGDGGNKQVVVELPFSVTVNTIEIDPGAGCGDNDSASLGSYDFQVSVDGSAFTSVAAGTFSAGNNHHFNVVTPTSKPTGTRFVRLIAKGTQGSPVFMDVSEMKVFGTASAPAPAPAVVTGATGTITASSAVVTGTVDPNGLQATYHFEYGVGSSLGSSTSNIVLSAVDDPVAVNSTLSGLAPSTSYSYRLVAQSPSGTTQGETRTFTTTAAATGTGTPTATPPSASPVTGTAPPIALPASVSGVAKALRRGVKSARIKCTNRGATKVTCKVTFAGAKRKRKVSARLTLDGAVLAKGSVSKADGKGTITLSGAKGLEAGAYRLSIKVGRKTFKFKVALA